MVDRTNMNAVLSLYSELTLMETATKYFDEGGRIFSMTISPPVADPSVQPQPVVTVGTDYIDYPPQMVDAIKAAFEGRKAEIANELIDLGVTGLPDSRRRRR